MKSSQFCRLFAASLMLAVAVAGCKKGPKSVTPIDPVKVNAVIAVLLQEGESADVVAAPKAAPATKEEPKAEAPKADAGAVMRENAATQASAPAAKPPAPAKSEGGKVFASPLARRLAKEAGIDVSAISGSGPKGRVVKSDVEAAKSGKAPLKAVASAPAAATGGAALAGGMSKAQVLALYPEGSYELVPNDGMRKTVAARLQGPGCCHLCNLCNLWIILLPGADRCVRWT